MNLYANFHCAPLHINKALGSFGPIGIFRELIPTTRTITTRVAFWDPSNGSKQLKKHLYIAVVTKN